MVVKGCEKECIQLLTFGVKNVKGGQQANSPPIKEGRRSEFWSFPLNTDDEYDRGFVLVEGGKRGNERW